jgi:hypothetical protein
MSRVAMGGGQNKGTTPRLGLEGQRGRDNTALEFQPEISDSDMSGGSKMHLPPDFRLDRRLHRRHNNLQRASEQLARPMRRAQKAPLAA